MHVIKFTLGNLHEYLTELMLGRLASAEEQLCGLPEVSEGAGPSRQRCLDTVGCMLYL